ncbi:MAG: RNA chaperone Hfq [Acidobacteria bacterium]|nr:RNA chaperone Hfq [Acidobacteriota bacterium]
MGNRRPPLESANRKLIRPSLTEFKEQQQAVQQQQAPPQRKPQKRPVPPEQTNAENFYYVKQMQSRTPMVVVLNDGEELHGVIEWYDRGCIKVNRPAGPNLLIYKANIKYLYKESDKNGEPA